MEVSETKEFSLDKDLSEKALDYISLQLIQKLHIIPRRDNKEI